MCSHCFNCKDWYMTWDAVDAVVSPVASPVVSPAVNSGSSATWYPRPGHPVAHLDVSQTPASASPIIMYGFVDWYTADDDDETPQKFSLPVVWEARAKQSPRARRSKGSKRFKLESRRTH